MEHFMRLDCCSPTSIVASLLTFALAYWAYVRKFKHYIYLQPDDVVNGTRPRGKCPPFYPNGWYRFLNSDELRVNEVKYLDYCGRHIAMFRGTNNTVYAVHAFCSHMGANLGTGGKVKHTQCIQCPFHGWIFNGETGECVVSAESLVKKHIEQFEYNNGVKEPVRTSENKSYLKKCHEGSVQLKTYQVREINGSIFVWLDSRKKFEDNPPYEPFEKKIQLNYRGESINFVNCHVQEIPENGADIRHFDFLHTKFIGFLHFDWSMLSHRGDEPDLCEVMKHRYNFINEFKMDILKKYINEENKKYTNVISLDCYIKIFRWKFFFFNATGFQLGPGLVYLFLKSIFFETAFEQAIVPMQKFHIRVSHKIFTSSYLPYWLTAYMLYGEVLQLFSDMAIWNNKVIS
jgi:cholesterol 7-dehydrogenase